MSFRHHLFSAAFCSALPVGALLVGTPAFAEALPPLTVVQDGDLPQEIEPTKLAVLDRARPRPATAVTRLAALAHADLARVWQAAADTNAPVSRAADQCQPQKIYWQRSCADVGYPESYGGVVRGMSQVDCATQTRIDSWLANSCAPMVAQVPAKAVLAEAAPVVAAPAAVAAEQAEQLPRSVAAEAAVAGQCGSAAERQQIAKPETGLCLAGSPGQVVGSGPWQWQCSGSADAASATCFAPVDYAALAAMQPEKAIAAPAPVAVVPPVQQDVAAPAVAAAREPQTALITPQLATPTLATTTVIVEDKSVPLATAALATPRLDLALRSNRPEPGTTDYAPATPIRAASTLYPGSAASATIVPAELKTIALTAGKDAPEEAVMAQLEMLGQKLAVNRLARVTVTAYAGMTDGFDARAARKLSLARAMVVRDALMMGGATSDQIRMRALGANTAAGASERVDLTDN